MVTPSGQALAFDQFSLGTVPRTPKEQVDAAVAAHEAFLTWREQSWVKRGEVIDELAQLIKRDVESLSRMVTIECGKPINEGRADVVEALHMAQYVAGLSRLPY
ncbi:MAG: aldehyde dehydrogenase family protein, partial [Fimbriimonadaceae bacterium]|nr:aldehyde dehydrogenase family protein [Fimbriimonadaceae bacterium]